MSPCHHVLWSHIFHGAQGGRMGCACRRGNRWRSVWTWDRHGKVWPILASGTSDNLWYLDVHHIPPTLYVSLHIHGIWMYLHDIWVRFDTIDIIDIRKIPEKYLFLSHFSDLSYLDIWMSPCCRPGHKGFRPSAILRRVAASGPTTAIFLGGVLFKTGNLKPVVFPWRSMSNYPFWIPYPPVSIQKTMENHNFWWVNPL